MARWLGIALLAWFAGLPLLQPRVSAQERCARIVSLAPSITETLFALGLEAQVVGRSRFCSFPRKVQALPAVGGFVDPNYEAIAALRPTVVFFPEEFKERAERLTTLSITAAPLDQRTVRGILESIQTVGSICDKAQEAKALQEGLRAKADEISSRVQGARPVKVLVVVGSQSIDSVRSLYVSGDDGFYTDLVALAGGINVLQGKTKAAHALSLESLLELAPEVIVAIHPNYPDEVEGSKRALQAWSGFPLVPAVRNQRVHVLSSAPAYIPGPRYPELLDQLARIIHPERF